jgi:hypothetical protein
MNYLAIYRYEVPVDDRWHRIDLTGPVVHVASRSPEIVEFWAIHDDALPTTAVPFRVYGTGHPIERREALRYVGSALAAGGRLVWHLLASGDGPLLSGDLAVDRG